MSASDIYLAREPDLYFLLTAMEVLEKELSQMEKTYDWFLSDTRPLLEECKGILKNILEIDYDEQDTDEEEWDAEAERLFAELCIEREGASSYWGETED